MSIWTEFKQFAVKGDAVDMAIGIIIGASFNKIITSLVSDIIMPPIGLLLGGVDFKNLEVVLKKAALSATGETIPAVSLRYGQFINTMIDFLIVAFTIFMVIKLMNKVLKSRQPAKS
jgi:large conductance mechanosensitive channel